MKKILLLAAVLPAAWACGCLGIDLPEISAQHPANLEAPAGYAPLPSPVLAQYAPLYQEPPRKTNPMLGELYPEFAPGKAGSLDDWLPMHKPDMSGVPEGKFFCTMHPEVIRDMPGYCPKCGMTLVEKKKGMGHMHDPGMQPSKKQEPSPAPGSHKMPEPKKHHHPPQAGDTSPYRPDVDK